MEQLMNLAFSISFNNKKKTQYFCVSNMWSNFSNDSHYTNPICWCIGQIQHKQFRHIVHFEFDIYVNTKPKVKVKIFRNAKLFPQHKSSLWYFSTVQFEIEEKLCRNYQQEVLVHQL